MSIRELVPGEQKSLWWGVLAGILALGKQGPGLAEDVGLPRVSVKGPFFSSEHSSGQCLACPAVLEGEGMYLSLENMLWLVAPAECPNFS